MNKIYYSLLISMAVVLLGSNITYAQNNKLDGDINKDNIVNIYDLSILLNSYGTDGKKCIDNKYKCDLNNDKQVNIFDLSILLSNWSEEK